MNGAREAQVLDRAILEWIAAWAKSAAQTEDEFNALALRIFSYQLRHNVPYAKFAAARGYGPSRLPAAWREIPAAPSSAFKDVTLTTFDPARAALRFQTSGTTSGATGTHYMENAQLYEAALLACFDRYMLHEPAPARYLMLVPDPSERANSSLGHMLGHIAGERARDVRWYLHAEGLDVEGALADLAAAAHERIPVCIATTAFALMHLLEACAQRSVRLQLAPGSRVMETGGFKGRSRVVERETLYHQTCAALGLPLRAIVAEYGMTELTSQYYDSFASRDRELRVKAGPSWLRAYAVDLHGKPCEAGTIGRLVHVDLANRSSLIAVATDDLGYVVTSPHPDERFVLLGRPSDAPLRGCSLDAEALEARASF